MPRRLPTHHFLDEAGDQRRLIAQARQQRRLAGEHLGATAEQAHELDLVDSMLL